MSDTAIKYSVAGAASPARPRAFDTILYGGLVAGVLDITYALTFSALRGVTTTQVLQFVASGLIGRAAFGGGRATAALGLLLHFLIALLIAAIYYGASLRLPTLLRRPLLWGPLFGVAAYFVMNYVVVPLSATPKPSSPFSLASFVSGLLVHAFFIGLPIALFARRSAATR